MEFNPFQHGIHDDGKRLAKTFKSPMSLGDSCNTYWECKERRSDNGCGVRITPNQREPSPEPRINSCGKDKDQYEKECQIYLSNHQQHFSKHCRW